MSCRFTMTQKTHLPYMVSEKVGLCGGYRFPVGWHIAAIAWALKENPI